jgi:arginine repressor
MSRMRTDLSKQARQELILAILENYKKDCGLTVRDIYELLNQRVEVVQRTIQRDLEELSLIYPIFDEIIDGKTYWKLEIAESHKREYSLLRMRYINEIVQKLLIEKEKAETSV